MRRINVTDSKALTTQRFRSEFVPMNLCKSQSWWCKFVSLALDREGTRYSLASLSKQTSELQLMRDSISRNMVEGTWRMILQLDLHPVHACELVCTHTHNTHTHTTCISSHFDCTLFLPLLSYLFALYTWDDSIRWKF